MTQDAFQYAGPLVAALYGMFGLKYLFGEQKSLAGFLSAVP
ncbi:hypothetical protein P8605_06185 [Streptomyces sp. T-3]|nr:hypothetical protein [Streptomyces sp. T-3]